MFPLNQHFQALRTVAGLMDGGGSCAFHTENGHDLLMGNFPKLQAGNNGHFFVRLTLGFNKDPRDGTLEYFLSSFNDLFLIK